MTPADRNCSGAVRKRLPLVVLLCSVALGIIGMHGVGFGPGSGDHVGHHTAATMITSTDIAPDVLASPGIGVGGEAPPTDDGGLFTLCLMVLTSGLMLGSWLLVTAARRGGWRLPRLVGLVVAASDMAGLPPPIECQPTVLRI